MGNAASLDELIASIPMRLLYGGITEEILLRWGVMAPIAFGLWWLRNRLRERTGRPPAAVLWAALAASAVAFGVGHLPALASTFDLTTALVVRTILLNAIVGVALGWLFWRRSLETAMLAHVTFHVVLVTGSVAETMVF
ncbi:MAG: type II CAAX prenyl endopeptidase Rce1 family protein [Halodesulfurarchaeum sp.]